MKELIRMYLTDEDMNMLKNGMTVRKDIGIATLVVVNNPLSGLEGKLI